MGSSISCVGRRIDLEPCLRPLNTCAVLEISEAVMRLLFRFPIDAKFTNILSGGVQSLELGIGGTASFDTTRFRRSRLYDKTLARLDVAQREPQSPARFPAVEEGFMKPAKTL